MCYCNVRKEKVVSVHVWQCLFKNMSCESKKTQTKQRLAFNCELKQKQVGIHCLEIRVFKIKERWNALVVVWSQCPSRLHIERDSCHSEYFMRCTQLTPLPTPLWTHPNVISSLYPYTQIYTTSFTCGIEQNWALLLFTLLYHSVWMCLCVSV